jgi:hypothetical protein
LFKLIQTGEDVKRMSKGIKNCLDKLLIDHCSVLSKSVRQQVSSGIRPVVIGLVGIVQA